MREEIMAVRMEPKLKRDIELISKVLHISPAEWIRTRVAYEVKRSVEDLRYQIVLEYYRGNLTKEELKELFGEKIAENIDFIDAEMRREAKKAEEMVKEMKRNKAR